MMMLRLMTMMTMTTVKRHYINTTGLIDFDDYPDDDAEDDDNDDDDDSF